MMVDETYRKEFLHQITEEMRETFVAQSEYLRLREAA